MPRFLRPAHFFVLPHVAFLVVFAIGPAVYAVLLSFATFDKSRPQFFEAGLRNYETAYGDFRFADAFVHVAQFLAISVPVGVLGVVALALVLHERDDRIGSLMRTVYFVPGAVAGPAVVLLAIFMFDPLVSPFGPVLSALGVTSVPDVARGDRLPFLFAMIGFFAGAGGWIAIFYGALNGVSRDVIEAAIVDGCGSVRLAVSIKLPLIRPYVVYMLMLTLAGNIQLFAEPQLLRSAPGTAISKTWSLNQLGYSFAFDLGNLGAAAAISLLMVGVGLACALLIIGMTGFFRTEATH